jgi:hypothetical protein
MNDNEVSNEIGRRSILAAAAAAAAVLAVGATAPTAANAQGQRFNLDEVLERTRRAARGQDLVRPPTLPPRWQGRPADDKQVLDTAEAIIREMRLDERYDILRGDRVSPAPLFVQDQTGRPQYYIVLYGLRNQQPSVQVALLLDATTGTFKEVGDFGRPMRYLTEQEARTLVSEALQPPQRSLVQTARLVVQPGAPRVLPLWEVTVGNLVFVFDQYGRPRGKIEPNLAGN